MGIGLPGGQDLQQVAHFAGDVLGVATVWATSWRIRSRNRRRSRRTATARAPSDIPRSGAIREYSPPVVPGPARFEHLEEFAPAGLQVFGPKAAGGPFHHGGGPEAVVGDFWRDCGGGGGFTPFPGAGFVEGGGEGLTASLGFAIPMVIGDEMAQRGEE